jgi:hypothetical protein
MSKNTGRKRISEKKFYEELRIQVLKPAQLPASIRAELGIYTPAIVRNDQGRIRFI